MTDEELLNIGRAVQRAAASLPAGWGICIQLECGSGTVYLSDPGGCATMIDDGELFSEQINSAIERAAIEGYQQKISQPSGFGGRCWQCWPKICKCPSSPDEVESIKSERYLLDRELQRENRRAQEFSVALAALSSGITQHRDRLLAAHGLDGVPEDLHRLGEQAKQVAVLMDEPRNADRVSALYKDMENEQRN